MPVLSSIRRNGTYTYMEAVRCIRQFLFSQRRYAVHLWRAKCHRKYQIVTACRCISQTQNAFRPDPAAWGAQRSPGPSSRLGRGIFLPHSPSLDAVVSISAPLASAGHFPWINWPGYSPGRFPWTFPSRFCDTRTFPLHCAVTR